MERASRGQANVEIVTVFAAHMNLVCGNHAFSDQLGFFTLATIHLLVPNPFVWQSVMFTSHFPPSRANDSAWRGGEGLLRDTARYAEPGIELGMRDNGFDDDHVLLARRISSMSTNIRDAAPSVRATSSFPVGGNTLRGNRVTPGTHHAL
ncbi:hypothetical protein J3459_010245 [Metarhizium acridum]|uniref:uncharacterized protein n=1 Tax=Metarhizium acridum TaxID=92637 RepID=UPI001C6BBE3B|nr:hypothetical protein J3459_010245 [Metarhizium acridum]KAG8425175.1 hypothetical protein J3458_001904 [Metarhizium acridum]